MSRNVKFLYLLAAVFAVIANGTGMAQSAEAGIVHLRPEPTGSVVKIVADVSPGDLVSPIAEKNPASWRFDGTTTILYSVPSNSKGFESDFTWEGFFLTPKANHYLAETGIGDRLISQFAFEKGNWTRLAIGLVGDRNNQPQLSVSLEGFEGRTFGMGYRPVTPDQWHHFALVHEGTPDAARIHWYLDHERVGEILLGGQANQNTLRPPGSAPFTIGARLKENGAVNRGFDGFVDEVRLTPRPLKPGEFLRTATTPSTTVNTDAMLRNKRESFWTQRHRWARKEATAWMPTNHPPNLLFGSNQKIDDSTFLRRLALTVSGRIPTLPEIEEFLNDPRADKRARVIDKHLASSEWADGWVGYWQDVLAENPSVVFPTLNNSGPFRQWIHESFRVNLPFDRFATELLLMEGSGGKGTEDSPASFALATGNDAPMAMRANVALKAFAAVDLKCARCHDSRIDRFRQSDLFLLAAYLNNGALKIPATSVAAAAKGSVVKTSLKAGQTISPKGLKAHWLNQPGDSTDLNPIKPGNHRAELAAMITSPRNSRFSDVIVNRVWKRYFGKGLIEPVDYWNNKPEATNAPLLRYLSSYLVRYDYDLKALARLILTSPAWQMQKADQSRMSAEQLVDSLFVAAGKKFSGETLGVHATDPGSAQLPQPNRSWQFAALPNERDRPALGMPVNQTIVDVLSAFGWKGSRQQPRTDRENITTPLQPLILFNGLVSQRIVRLSDSSAITKLCLQDQPISQLIDRLFLTVLSRRPDMTERSSFIALLKPGYEQRRTGNAATTPPPLSTFQPDWRKHLQAEQTQLMLAAQHQVALGEPPTRRLTNDFRERVEDCLWALINTPEFALTQ